MSREQLVNNVSILLGKRNYDQAISDLWTHLSLYPNDIKIRQLLRGIYHKRMQDGRVKKPSAGVVALKNFFLKIIAQINRALKPEKAMQMCEKILKDAPDDASTLMLLGGASYKAGHLETAILVYEYAREVKRENTAALKRLAELYEENKNPSKALARIEEYMRLKPDDQNAKNEAHRLAGLKTIEDGKWEDTESFKKHFADAEFAEESEKHERLKTKDPFTTGVERLKSKIAAEPNNAIFHSRLGDLYLERRMFAEAEKAYSKASELDPTNNEYKMNLGNVKLVQLENTINELEEHSKTSPDDEELKKKLAQAKDEYRQRSITEFEWRANAYPTDMNIKMKLGELYFETGKIDDALKQFQQATVDSKNKLQAMNMMGMCFVKKGLLDFAVDQFKKAVESMEFVSVNNFDIIYNLGKTYEELGRYAEAEEQYKKIYERDISYKDISERVEYVYKKAREGEDT